MDLNELLFHHQVALIGASEPSHRPDAVAHYSRLLEALRQRLGVAPYPAAQS